MFFELPPPSSSPPPPATNTTGGGSSSYDIFTRPIFGADPAPQAQTSLFDPPPSSVFGAPQFDVPPPPASGSVFDMPPPAGSGSIFDAPPPPSSAFDMPPPSTGSGSVFNMPPPASQDVEMNKQPSISIPESEVPMSQFDMPPPASQDVEMNKQPSISIPESEVPMPQFDMPPPAASGFAFNAPPPEEPMPQFDMPPPASQNIEMNKQPSISIPESEVPMSQFDMPPPASQDVEMNKQPSISIPEQEVPMPQFDMPTPLQAQDAGFNVAPPPEEPKPQFDVPPPPSQDVGMDEHPPGSDFPVPTGPGLFSLPPPDYSGTGAKSSVFDEPPPVADGDPASLQRSNEVVTTVIVMIKCAKPLRDLTFSLSRDSERPTIASIASTVKAALKKNGLKSFANFCLKYDYDMSGEYLPVPDEEEFGFLVEQEGTFTFIACDEFPEGAGMDAAPAASAYEDGYEDSSRPQQQPAYGQGNGAYHDDDDDDDEFFREIEISRSRNRMSQAHYSFDGEQRNAGDNGQGRDQSGGFNWKNGNSEPPKPKPAPVPAPKPAPKADPLANLSQGIRESARFILGAVPGISLEECVDLLERGTDPNEIIMMYLGI